MIRLTKRVCPVNGPALAVGEDDIAYLPSMVERPTPVQSAYIYEVWARGDGEALSSDDVVSCLVRKGLLHHLN